MRAKHPWIHTLSVAIFIHSSKLASNGMTRFMGVTALPATPGMPSWSCDGVCGLSSPTSCETLRRAGVPEERIELRWASLSAWRRFAFSCRSSLRGTLSGINKRHDMHCFEILLHGRLLRRGRDAVLCCARHLGGVVDASVVDVGLFVNISRRAVGAPVGLHSPHSGCGAVSHTSAQASSYQPSVPLPRCA